MRNSRGTRSKLKIRQRVIQYIEENIRSYLILLIVFFIGIILGIIFINNSNEEQVTQITTYINNFIDSMKNNYQISTNTLYSMAKFSIRSTEPSLESLSINTKFLTPISA